MRAEIQQKQEIAQMTASAQNPPLVLYYIADVYWQSDHSPDDGELFRLSSELFSSGRKMAKGLQLAATYSHLCTHSRFVIEWLCRHAAAIEKMHVISLETQEAWLSSLEYMSRDIALLALAKQEKNHVLGFFPMLFPSRPHEAAVAGAYGAFDIASHVHYLKRLRGNIQPDAYVMTKTLEQRLAYFNEAYARKTGIIEIPFLIQTEAQHDNK
jgi:hypothetical protein